MKPKKLYSFIALSSFGYSLSVNGHEYPLEFADFFEQRSELIEVVVEGLPRSETLVANVSYDVFQLPGTLPSSVILTDFLLRQNLTEQAAVAIVKQLDSGVIANPGCKKMLSSCIPDDEPGKAEFVFDYDAKLLRIFISSDMFENISGEKEYYNPITAKGALVNWSNLYAYSSQDTQSSIAWTNETLLGLPMGYLSVNSQYQNIEGEQEFDLYRAIYSYEQDDLRIIAGYQDSNSISLNSTDFLNNGGDYSGLMATLGSSTNLLKGELSALQRLFFFVPQGGQLEVYQGEQLLLTKVVNAGDQSVGYDELPIGTYTVTLRLKQGSTVVFEEQRQVVNSASFALPIGQWDYRFEIGRFEKNEKEINVLEPTYPLVEHRAYLRALFSYRPTESWLMGAGVVSNGQNQQGLLGSRYSFSDRINLQYTAGHFSSGDVYQFGQLSFAPVSFTMRQLEHNNVKNPDGLTQLMYGPDNFTEYGIGVSGYWGRGRTYANYYRNETEDHQSKSSSDNVTLTWTHPLWGGDLSINASLSKSGLNDESYSVGGAWSRRFGESIQGNIGTSINNNDQIYTYADASYTHTEENWSSTSRVGGQSYSGSKSVLTGSVSLAGSNNALRYDAFGYVNTNGDRSVSGSLSGTQMVSLSSVALTSERGLAYIEITPTWENQQEALTDAQVNYTALRNGEHWFNDTVTVGQSQLVNLPIYSQVEFALDTDSQNIDANDENGDFFVMPGTYYQLDNTVVPLASQIFILNDMNGEPVQHARCIGEGCKNVEMLSVDGVFRVNYRPHLPFKLVSEKRLCVYNPELSGERYIQAYCLPGLENVDGQLVRQNELPTIAQVKGSEPLIYIGKYESNEEINGILRRLDEVGLTSKAIEIGATQYLYVQYQVQYSVAQRALLENLDAYVISDSINTKQLFTLRLEDEENS